MKKLVAFLAVLVAKKFDGKVTITFSSGKVNHVVEEAKRSFSYEDLPSEEDRSGQAA